MRKLLLLLCLVPALLGAQNLAISGVRVYSSPDAKPIDHATILIEHGKISAIGTHVIIPSSIKKLSCENCVVFAGFWNTHVHFTEAKWNGAEQLPAEKLTKQLREMLTHSGFTTVVDTGSNPRNTAALRSRIESLEVAGPHIYTAGTPLYPPHAIPFYLSDLPTEVRRMLPQPETSTQAVAAVERNIAAGSDIVKLFTGSYVAPGRVVPMPLDVAFAAVKGGHEHGQLVFAHPSNAEGVRIAMNAGVDVLAHAPDTVEGVDDQLIAELVEHHMAMIPTLKLFSQDKDIARIRQIVADFHQQGGLLMFGTDTGFLTDYSMDEEYRQLALAGLSWRDILAMLTTNPAKLFRVNNKGKLSRTMAGDLTILAADPEQAGTQAFAQVRFTIRNGNIIYAENPLDRH